MSSKYTYEFGVAITVSLDGFHRTRFPSEIDFDVDCDDNIVRAAMMQALSLDLACVGQHLTRKALEAEKEHDDELKRKS